MENFSGFEKSVISSHSENEEIEYIIISLNMVSVEDVDTIFIKFKNIKTGLYLIRTPLEIIINHNIAFRFSKKNLIHISYLPGYEHNARGASMLDEDYEEN